VSEYAHGVTKTSLGVVGSSGLGWPLQEGREPLAGTDMALLRGRAELARAHVLDHALTQRLMASVPMANS
jgi:hypothetical protein